MTGLFYYHYEILSDAVQWADKAFVGFDGATSHEIEDEGDIYESIEDIWPDYPSKEDFFFNEDEY